MTGWLRLESGDYINPAWVERMVKDDDGTWIAVSAFNPRPYRIAQGEVERLGIDVCEGCGSPIAAESA